jgi:hypothetical protein
MYDLSLILVVIEDDDIADKYHMTLLPMGPMICMSQRG